MMILLVDFMFSTNKRVSVCCLFVQHGEGRKFCKEATNGCSSALILRNIVHATVTLYYHQYQVVKVCMLSILRRPALFRKILASLQPIFSSSGSLQDRFNL